MSLAVFTDLDDTLFGSTAAEQRSTQAVIRLLQKKNIPLFAVTGRSFNMITDASPFTGLACEVGTRLYLKQSPGKYTLSSAYDRYIAQASGFKHTIIQALAETWLLKMQHQFPHVNLQFQPLKQKYKISFTFQASVTQGLQLQQVLQSFFKKAHYPKIQVLLSAATTLPQKNLVHYNLDILAAGKETAVAYLAKRYQYQPIVAGDGGNDIPMLLSSPWAAVIVGGYKPEVQQALQLYLQQPAQKLIYIESGVRRRGPTSLLRGLRMMLA